MFQAHEPLPIFLLRAAIPVEVKRCSIAVIRDIVFPYFRLRMGGLPS
jgi:hypothetical protein